MGHRCAKTLTHLRREGGCLPDCCRATQIGATPLQLAVNNDHEDVVKRLIAAEVPNTLFDATNKVCVSRGEERGQEGVHVRHAPRRVIFGCI